MASSASIVLEKPNLRSSSSSLTLLSLPGEIQNRIYKFVFEEAVLEVSERFRFTSHAVYRQASRCTTLVSKQIRSEARPAFLAQTLIIFPDLGVLATFLKGGQRYGVVTRARTIKVGESSHPNMPPDLPSLQRFMGFRTLILEWRSKIRWEVSAEEEPPDLEKLAIRDRTNIFELAKNKTSHGIGRYCNFVEALKVSEHVKVKKTVILFSALRRHGPIVGVSLRSLRAL